MMNMITDMKKKKDMKNCKMIYRAMALMMIVMALTPLGATGQNIRGDFNMDGTVDVADVTATINYLLNGQLPEEAPQLDTVVVNGVPIVTVLVKGGTFIPPAAPGTSTSRVTLPDYSIGVTEVTIGMWKAVMDSTHLFINYPDELPLFAVTWNDTQKFIARLNELTGLNFRLPTDDEWLYAAIGGNRSMYHMYAGSDDPAEVGWWMNDVIEAAPVATKAPNELGIYDMSGNVSELIDDLTYIDDDNYDIHSVRYCYRGGSISDEAWPLYQQGSTFRPQDDPDLHILYMGFRLAR